MFSRKNNHANQPKSPPLQTHQVDTLRRRQHTTSNDKGNLIKEKSFQKLAQNRQIKRTHHPMAYQSIQKDILKPSRAIGSTSPVKKFTELPMQRPKQSQIPNIKNEIQFELCLKLSDKTVQRLKKMGRYDRKIYLQQSGDLYRNVITQEMKRIERVKNLNRHMRLKTFDNELTITFINNLLRLVNELDFENRKNYQQKKLYEQEQKKRRQGKIKKDLEQRRGVGSNKKKQDQIKKIMIDIDGFATTKDDENLKKSLKQLLDKYGNEESVFMFSKIYKALYDSLISKEALKEQEKYLNSLVASLTEMNKKNFSESMASIKQQRKNIKNAVDSRIPKVQPEKSQQKTQKPSSSLDPSTKRLLHDLDNLQQLYDLIIYNYQSQYEHKRNRRKRLMIQKSKLNNLGSMSPSVLVVDDLWGSKYSGDSMRSSRSHSRSKGDRSIRKIRLTYDDKKQKDSQIDEDEYLNLLEKQINVLKGKLDQYSKKQKDMVKFGDKIQQIARKIQYEKNPTDFIRKISGELKLEMTFMSMTVSTNFVKIIDKIVNSSSRPFTRSVQPQQKTQTKEVTDHKQSFWTQLKQFYDISSDNSLTTETRIAQLQRKLSEFRRQNRITPQPQNNRKSKLSQFQKQISNLQPYNIKQITNLIARIGELIIQKQKSSKEIHYKGNQMKNSTGTDKQQTLIASINQLFNRVAKQRAQRKTSDEKHKNIDKLLVTQFRKMRNLVPVQKQFRQVLNLYETDIKNQAISLKNAEVQIKKLTKDLERQRLMNDQLKKSLKLAEFSVEKSDQFHAPSHSDTQELKYIQQVYNQINKGGQWWNKLPRRLKRHDSFAPVYGIIQKLKQQQIKNNQQNKNQNNIQKQPSQPPRGYQRQVSMNSQKQVDELRNSLQMQKKRNATSEQKLKKQQIEKNRLKQQINKYQKLRLNSVSSDKQLQRRNSQNQELRRQINGLKKQVKQASSSKGVSPKHKDDANQRLIMNLRNDKDNYQKQAKYLGQTLNRIENNVTKCSKTSNVKNYINQLIQKGTQNQSQVRIYKAFIVLADKITQQTQRDNNNNKNMSDGKKLKQSEDKIKELQKIIANQKKMNAQLRKSLKIPIMLSQVDQKLSHQHSDGQQLQYLKSVYEKIKQGGQWWNKIPRRLKRHQSFSAVYSIIELLKDKQIQIAQLNKQAPSQKKQSPVQINRRNNYVSGQQTSKLKQQIENLKNDLANEQKRKKKVEDQIKIERAKSTEWRKKSEENDRNSDKFKSLETKLQAKQSQLQKLRQQLDGLRKQLRGKDTQIHRKNNENNRNTELSDKIKELEGIVSIYTRYAKSVTDILRKINSKSGIDGLDQILSKQKDKQSKILKDFRTILEKQVNNALMTQQKQIKKIEDDKNKMQNLLENQRKMNQQLRKNYNISINVSDSHLEQQPHTNYAEQLAIIANIEKKIKQGGQWWKKIPKRIRRHDSMTPVYNIIQMLKDKQIQNMQLKQGGQKQQNKRTRTIQKPQVTPNKQRQLSAENNKLTKQLEQQKTKVKALTEKNSILTNKIQANKDNTKDKLNLQRENTKLEKEIQFQKQIVDKANSQVKKLQKQLSQKNAKLSQLQKKLNQARNLQKQLNNQKNKAKNIADRQKGIQQENSELRRRIDELEKANAEVKKLENALQNEQNKTKNTADRQKGIQQENSELRRRIDELEKANAEVKKLENALQNEQNKTKNTADRQKGIQQENNQLQKKIRELQRDQNRVSQLERSLNIQKQKKEKISQRQQFLKAQNNELKQKIKQLQDELNKSKGENSELSPEKSLQVIQDLQKQLNQLKQNQNRMMNNYPKNTEQLQKQLKQKDQQIDQLNKKLYHQQNKSINQQFQKYLDEVKAQNNKLKSQNQQISDQLQKIRKLNQDLLSQKQQNNKLKEQQGIKQNKQPSSQTYNDLQQVENYIIRIHECEEPREAIDNLRQIDIPHQNLANIRDKLIKLFQKFIARIPPSENPENKELESEDQEGLKRQNQMLKQQVQNLKQILQIKTYDEDGLPGLDLSKYSIDSNKDIAKLEILLANLQKQWHDKYKNLEMQRQDILNKYQDDLALKEQQIFYLNEGLEGLVSEQKPLNQFSQQTSSILMKNKFEEYKQLEEKQLPSREDLVNKKAQLQQQIQRKENIVSNLQQQLDNLKKKVEVIQSLLQKQQSEKQGIYKNIQDAAQLKDSAQQKIEQLLSQNNKLQKTIQELNAQINESNKEDLSKSQSEENDQLKKKLQSIQKINSDIMDKLNSEIQKTFANESRCLELQAQLVEKQRLLQKIKLLAQNSQNQVEGLSKELLQEKAQTDQQINELQNKIKRYDRENRELRALITAQQKQNQQLNQQILKRQQLQNQIENLQQKMRKTQRQNQEGIKQKQDQQKRKLKELTDQLQQAKKHQADKQILEIQLQKLKKQINFKQNDLQTLQNQYQKVVQDNYKLKSENQQLNDRSQLDKIIDNLERQIARKTKTVQQQNKIIQGLQKQITKAHEDAFLSKQDAQSQAEGLKKKVVLKDKDISNLSFEKQKLQLQVQNLNSQLFELQSKPNLQSTLNQLKKDEETKRKMIDTYKQKIQALEKQLQKIHQLQLENESIENQRELLKRQVQSKDRQIASLRSQIHQLIEDMNKINQQLHQQQNISQSHEAKINQLRQQVEQKQRNIDSMQRQMKKLGDQLDRQRDISKQKDVIEVQKDSLKRQLDSKQRNLQQATNELQNYRKNHCNELRQKQTQIQEYSNKIRDLQNKIKQIRKDHEIKVTHHQSMISSLKNQLNQQENMMKQQNRSVQRVQILERQVIIRNQQIQNIAKEVDRYKKINLTPQKNEDYNYMIDQLQRQIQRKQDDINAAQKQIEYQKQLRASIAQKLQDRRRKLQISEEENVDLKINKIELQRQLANLKRQKNRNDKQIKQLEIQIARRQAQINQRQMKNSQLISNVNQLQRKIRQLNSKVQSKQHEESFLKDQHHKLIKQKQQIYIIIQKCKKENQQTLKQKYETQRQLQLLRKDNRNMKQRINNFERELQNQKDHQKAQQQQLRNNLNEKDKLINKLKIQIQNLTKINIDLNNIQDRLAQLTIQLQSQKAQKERLRSKNDHLKNNMENNEQTMRKLNQQLAYKDNQLNRMAGTLDKLQKDAQKYRRQSDNANSQLHSLTITIKGLQNQVQRGRQNQKRMMEKNQELEHKVNNQAPIKHKVNQLEDKVQNQNRIIDNYEKQIKPLNAKLRDLENQIQKTKRDNDNNRRQRDNLQNQLKNTRKDNDKMKSQIEDLKGLQINITQLKTDNTRKQNQRKNLQNKLNDLEKDLYKYKDREGALQAKVDKTERDFNKVKIDLGNRDRQNEKLKRQNQNLKNRLNEIQITCNQLKNKPDLQITCNQLKRQLEGKDRVISGLKKTIENLQDQICKERQQNKGKQGLEFKITNLNKQIQLKQKQIKNLKSTIQSQKDQIRKLDRQLQNYRNQEVSSRSVDPKVFEKQLALKDRHISNLNNQLNQSQKQIDDLREELSNLKGTKIIKLENQLKNKQRQIAYMRPEIEAIKRQRIDKQNQINDLSEKLSSHYTSQFEIDNLKRELKLKDNQIQKKDIKITYLQKQVNQLSENNKSYAPNYIPNHQKDLQAKQRQINALKQSIQRLQNQLQNQRDQLNDLRSKHDLLPQVEQLRRQIIHLNKLLQNQKKANKLLEQQLEQQRLQNCRVLPSDLHALKLKLQNKEKQIQVLKKNMEKMKDDLNDNYQPRVQFNNETQIDNLRRQLQRTKSLLEQQKSVTISLRKQITDITIINQKIKQENISEYQVQSLKKQIHTKTTEIESLTKSYHHLQTQLQRQHQQNIQLRNQHDLRPQIQQLKRQLAHNINLLQNQKKANQLLEQQLEQQRKINQNSKTSPQADTFKRQINYKEEKIKELNRLINERNSTDRMRITQLQQELYQYRRENQSLKSQINHLKKQVAKQLQNTSAVSKQKYATYGQNILISSDQRQQISYSFAKFGSRESLDAPTLQNQIIQSLRQQLSHSNRENDKLVQQNTRLKQSSRVLESKLDSLENQVKKLKLQLHKLSPQIPVSPGSTNLVNLKKYKQSQGDDQSYSNEAQLQIIKRINLEVADLAEINHRLQLKIQLIENDQQIKHDLQGDKKITVSKFIVDIVKQTCRKVYQYCEEKEYIRDASEQIREYQIRFDQAEVADKRKHVVEVAIQSLKSLIEKVNK